MLSVINRIPRSTKNMPPIKDITFRYLENLLIYSPADPIPAAMSRNGITNPEEKISSSNAPWSAVAEVEASKRTEPRIGPTHGVQPKANAAPRIKELSAFPRSKIFGTLNCFSDVRKGILKTFIMKSPKIITNKPPILVSQNLYGTSPLPTKPANVPSVIKTTLKPTTKAKPLRNIFQRADFFFSGSFKSSRDTPLINPK